jgi:hypothetical protein
MGGVLGRRYTSSTLQRLSAPQNRQVNSSILGIAIPPTLGIEISANRANSVCGAFEMRVEVATWLLVLRNETNERFVAIGHDVYT